MRIYLVRHGKNLAKDVDPEKGLSAEGRAEVEQMADLLQAQGVQVTRIGHSGITRARQTAELFAAALKPAAGVAEVAGLAPLDDVSRFATNAGLEDGDMLVGHLPFMGKLAGHLLADDPELPLVTFAAAGVVCLELQPATERWALLWALAPELR